MTIQNTSLEEILKLKNLKNKEYLLKEIAPNWNIEVQFKAQDEEKQKIHVGSYKIEGWDKKEEVKLDEAFLPYYQVKLGGKIEYKRYEPIFLGNTSFACAMGGYSENLRLNLLKKIKNQNHPLYAQFKSDIDKIIKQLPELIEKIHEAKQKKHYFGDRTEIKKYPYTDKRIIKCLALQIQKYIPEDSPDEFNPKYYNTNNIKLEDKQKYDCRGETKEEAVFLTWYYKYMISKRYARKIKSSEKDEKNAFREWINITAKELEDNGFKKVDKLSLT